jgi:hypothetical protein
MGRTILAAITLAALAGVAAEQPGAPARPAILLTDRAAQAAPIRSGCTYVGAGTVEVRQAAADTVVLTSFGAVVATGHPGGSTAVMDFDIDQGFEVAGGRAMVSLEGEIAGLLRGGRNAAASTSAHITVTAGDAAVVTADLPDRCVGGGENLTVNDRAGPDDVAVAAGPYRLHVHWRLSAMHPKGLRGKAASAEFAPEPALDPLWVGGPRDPFHGVAKKDFGLRVTVRISPVPATEVSWTGPAAARR